VLQHGGAQGLSLELSREQYLQLQQFIVDAQGTRRGRLDQDLERARCIYLRRPDPRFPVWYPTGPEGIRSGELCIPTTGEEDLVFSTFGGAASALAQRHGYRGRRSGALTFEMEWRPGQWVRLDALRPVRLLTPSGV
jgi:hypothetical protein